MQCKILGIRQDGPRKTTSHQEGKINPSGIPTIKILGSLPKIDFPIKSKSFIYSVKDT